MDQVIRVENLVKEYDNKKSNKKIRAVNNINLQVNRGEKVGYIGLNGAGKSTTIKLLTGLICPTSGKINILGFEPFKDRKTYVNHIGVLFGQRNQMFWDLKVKDSLEFNRHIYKLSKDQYEEKIKFFNKYIDLESLMDSKVMTLSLGQKMRCNLAMALLHSPEIIFLDEPTIGIDIFVKDEIRNLINEVNRSFNTTVLYTSHDMKDIEQICDRIIILEQGKIIEDLPIQKFNNKYGGIKRVKLFFDGDEEIETLESELWRLSSYKFISFDLDKSRKSLSCSFNDKEISTLDLLKIFQSIGLCIENAEINSSSLEDAIKNIYQS